MSRLSGKSTFRKTTLLSPFHLNQYLYKTTYEKQKGHYIGCRSAKEDPKLVWAANVLKMQNDRLYKKTYNDHKAKITIPADMVSINAAKEGQALASNVDYRQYLHQWSCFPDQNDIIQARKAYDLQSDVSAPPWEGSLPLLGLFDFTALESTMPPYIGLSFQHFPECMKPPTLLPDLFRKVYFHC